MKKPVSSLLKLVSILLLFLLTLLFLPRISIVFSDKSVVSYIVTTAVAFLYVIFYFVVSYWLVSAPLRAIGRDPDTCYRHYNNHCKAHLKSAKDAMQLERPVLPGDWLKKICTAFEIGFAMIVALALAMFNTEVSFVGCMLSILAPMGVFLVYLLLWAISKVVGDSDMRVRKIKKRG